MVKSLAKYLIKKKKKKFHFKLQTKIDVVESNMQTLIKPKFEPLVQHLLVQYQNQLRSSNFEIVPEKIWEELKEQVKYCGSVVSRQINFEKAYKIAQETLATHLMFANNLCGNQQQENKWAVRFCKNKRFVVADDLNDCFTTSPQTGELQIKSQKEAQNICDAILKEYRAAGLICPELEMVPFSYDESIIYWLILPYRQQS